MTGTATFLFTDVEGSTRLLRYLRDGYGRVLADHQRLLRDVFVRHRGEEIDTQGDSFFIAFRRPGDAVLAAVDAQRALAVHEWPEGAGLRVRIGIHSGQASVEENRYVGLAVHRAARICAAGHGGQILVSQTTVALIEDSEEELAGIELRDLGVQRLKDFERPVRVYQAVGAGLDEKFPPLRTLDAPIPERGTTPFAGGPHAEAPPPAAGWVRRRPRVAAVIAGAALALVATTAVVAARMTGSDGPPPVVPQSLVRIDPRTNRVEDVIRTPAVAEQVVATATDVWFLSGAEQSQTLFRMDVGTKEITTFGGIPAPCALAADPLGRIWVASCKARQSAVSRIDPASGRRARTYPVRGQIGALTVDREAIYVTILAEFQGAGGETCVRIPIAGGERTTFPVGAAPFSIALTEDAIWVANYESDSLTKIFLATGHRDEIPTSVGPLAFTGADAVWVSHFSDPVLWKFDPGSEHQVATTSFPKPVAVIAATPSGVWVASPADFTVYRLDPRSADIEERIRLGSGHAPAGIAATDDAVWITVTPPIPAG